MKKSMLGETLPLASIKKKKRLTDEDPLLSETLPLGTVKKKKRLTRKELVIRLGILGALLILTSIGAIFGVIEYQQYKQDVSLAQTGVQHLRTAESLLSKLAKNPFDTKSTSQAQQEFSAALPLFQQVSNSLNALPGIGTYIPIAGSKIAAAQHIVPLAIEVSQMGITACKTLNVLAPDLKNPMGTTGPKLTQADLTTASQNLQQIQATLNLLVNQVNHLQPGDLQLDPGLGKYVGTLRKDGPALQDAVNQAQSFLAVAPVLLGVQTPANYLLELLDSTELRPGGGFIGSYGTLTLSGGHVSNIFMTDVDLIDNPFRAAGQRIPFPNSSYSWFNLSSSWMFRDSNLDADFPTSARYGEQTYARELPYALQGSRQAEQLQGVVDITPWFLEGVLEITGPINMEPQYNETVTASNLIDRIHFHQLGSAGEGSDLIPSPDGHSSLRKRFTAYLADHIITQVRGLMSSPSSMSKLFKLVATSLHTKDLQIYFNSSVAENVLQHYQLASTIQAPASGDSFLVVDANLSPNKANDFIKYTMQDEVTIDRSGNAVHHTTLSYAWVLQGQHQNYGSPTYRDYVRVYVPPGSTLQSQNGWQAQGTSQAFGREVWAGSFTLVSEQTRVITLTWTSPKAARLDAQGWHYQDLLQKQAGDTWNINVQVTLPSCATNTRVSGGLIASGKQTATISHSLSEDTSLGIDYQCS